MVEDLKAKYGLFTAITLVVGVVIGVGIYFKAQPILLATGGSGTYAIYTWILGAILTLSAGLVISELVSSANKTGGIQVLMSYAYGERLGFSVGFSQTLLYFPMIICLEAYYSMSYTYQFIGFHANILEQFLLVIFFISFVFILNILSSFLGGLFQRVGSVLKLLPLLIIAIAGIFYHSPTSEVTGDNLHIIGAAMVHKSIFEAVGTALISVLFAFESWLFVSTITPEFKNPKRNIPLAIILGILIIAVIYIGFNVGILHVVSGAEIAYNSKNVNIFSIAELILSKSGGKFIEFFIVISAFIALNGYTLLAQRSIYGLFFNSKKAKLQLLLKVSKNNTPYVSAMVMYKIVCIYISVGFFIAYYYHNAEQVFNTYSDIPTILFWCFYVLLFVATVRIRKNKLGIYKKPNFKVPFLKVFVTIATMGGIYGIVGQIISLDTFELNYYHLLYFLFALSVAILGFLVYKYTEI